MTKARDLANLIAAGNPLADGAISVSEISDLTASAAELNYNDITTLGTVEASKVVTADANGDVKFPDGEKALFGAGSDLQIYHDGVHSRIVDAGTGNLNLQGDNLRLKTSDATGTYLEANNGGAVTITYNNSPKLATTNTGVDITGVLTTDGISTSADITVGDGDKAIFGAGSDLQIYHDTHSYIHDTGDGNLLLLTQGAEITLLGNTSSEYMGRFIQDGAVELYYNGAQKLATASTGVDITGELIADSYNETYAALSGTTPTVNCEAGNSFSLTLSGNTTFTFSNPPASGTSYTFSIEIIQDSGASGYTVTWPSSVDWPAATAPTLTATASAKDVFVFTTRDGGTNWYGFTAGQALA